MSFILGKVLDAVLMPVSWVIVILAFSWLQRFERYRRRLVGAALAVLIVLGWEPLPDMLLRPLESAYPELAPADAIGSAKGVVVLGGGLEPGYMAVAHAQPLLNDAGERIAAAAALAHQHPHLQLVFSGGEGWALGAGPTEAERARQHFVWMGIAPDRLRFEDQSRTTDENAVLSARLPGIQPTQPWLLLTSAWHMPRAMAAFRQAGWNVQAYPVDYRTAPSTPWHVYNHANSLRKWHLALHEYVGMAVYAIRYRLVRLPTAPQG